MTLAAIEAGKHVICEKPMAMNAGEAREMYERAIAASRTAGDHRPRTSLQPDLAHE
jgi:predicted dehydrogenase